MPPASSAGRGDFHLPFFSKVGYIPISAIPAIIIAHAQTSAIQLKLIGNGFTNGLTAISPPSISNEMINITLSHRNNLLSRMIALADANNILPNAKHHIITQAMSIEVARTSRNGHIT